MTDKLSLVALLLVCVMLIVVAANQYFIFSMWTDTRIDELDDQLTEQIDKTANDRSELESQISSAIGTATAAQTEAQNLNIKATALDSTQAQMIDEISQMNEEMESHSEEVSMDLQMMGEKVEEIENAILGASGAQLMMADGDNMTSTALSELSADGQIQYLMEKIEKNAVDIDTLWVEIVDLYNKTGMEVPPQLEEMAITTTTTSDDYSGLVMVVPLREGRSGDEPAINVTWDGMTDTCWDEPDNYADVRFSTSGDVEYNVVTVRIFIPTNYGSQSGQYLISVGDFTCEQIDYAQKDTWAESTCPAGTVGHEVK